MSVHVSVRLFWHDNGWNGEICRDPAGNVWCEGHEHVRTHKQVADEQANASKPLGEAGVPVGCEISAQAFATRRNEIRIWPPDWMEAQGVEPVDVSVDKYSTGMWPYEEMWDEDGHHKSNDERRAIVEAFFEEIEPSKSLVFFYVDERNPLFAEDDERSPHRVLVGIARVKSIEDIAEWNETTFRGEVNMVWSVPFQHTYPTDGIRLPVQAIEAAVPDVDERAQYLVPLDGGLRTDFRYGSARITNDRAVAVVERAISALAHLRDSGKIDTSVDAELEWLNEVLLELWEERGPYPGLAPVLAALECKRATEIQARVIPALISDGRDPAEVVFDALDGNPDPALADYEDDLEDAVDEWGYLEDEEKSMLRRLATIELKPEHVKCLLSAESRARHGLPAEAEALTENPYLLCESFIPKKDREPIGFITVDHGMVPHQSMRPVGAKPIRNRDPRRLRALLAEALWSAASDGDTFIRADDALAAVARLAPEDRPCDVPLARLSHAKVVPVLDETIEQFEIDGVPYLALQELAELEGKLETVFHDLVGRAPSTPPEIDWQDIADELAADEQKVADRVELSDEQKAALDRSFASPLSVLTGAAGTGKSTLLAPLVAALDQHEGKLPTHALTPTGKAADRLKDLGVEAMTIHRALARAGWYDWDLGVWNDEGDPIEVDTLIIDECSMVDLNLLGTLFRAVNWQGVRRLVLVGDHYQLPPIGPGRPFFDVIGRMQDADIGDDQKDPYRDRLSELTHNYRVAAGSQAIAFANGFARQPEPDEPLLWESLGKQQDLGDLRIRFWKEPEDLYRLLIEEIEKLKEQLCRNANLDPEAFKAFDLTIGHYESPYDASSWQVIAPMRGSPHGIRKLNATIQDHWHGWAKRANRAPNGAYIRWPLKFGDEQVTLLDKVMQISNEWLPYWARGEKASKKPRTAVFNGQIGTVRSSWPRHKQKNRRGSKERGAPRSISVEFEGLPDKRFDYSKNGWLSVDKHLELAFAITVHKGQGSQFRHVFFVVPQSAADFFGRELTYTGLTRAQESLTLFVQDDIGPLLALRKRSAAKTPQRNSRLFSAEVGNLPYRPGRLVFGTTRGERVSSKSEVIIADLLHRYERDGRLTYAYEQELHAPGGDGWDLRLPDFTVKVAGKTFYWEHCGMMDDPVYRAKWENVRLPWYKKNGFEDQLIVTFDGEDDPIDSGKIEDEVIKGLILKA